MSEKGYMATLVLAAIIVGVAGSGCLSGSNHNQTEVESGMIDISASLPVMVYPEGVEWPKDCPEQTWLCRASEDETKISFGAAANVKDLSDLDISIKMPNGETAYAKNFKMSEGKDGKWHIDANHKGIKFVIIDLNEKGYLFDGYVQTGQARSNDWDNISLVRDKKFLKDQRIQINLLVEQLK